MSHRKTLSRRDLLKASMAIPFFATTRSSVAATDSKELPASNVLVAYFSRSGNTRVIAGRIHRALGSALFEIQSATPYPEDYEETVEQARRERDSGYKPPLKATAPNIADYTTVFLGFPIWGETAPPVIRSFLANHDLSGKTLIPFITHGGYGLGNSLSVLAAHAPRARLLDAGLTMEADQERRTLEHVNRWLSEIQAKGQIKR
jgi:flavodoxin